MSIGNPFLSQQAVVEAPVPTPNTQPTRKYAVGGNKPKEATEEFLYSIFRDAGNKGVSDIHVKAGSKVGYEIDGYLTWQEQFGVITDDSHILTWMEYSEGYADRKVDVPEMLLEPKGHTTVAFATDGWRVRGAFRREVAGIGVTFRLIPSRIPTLADVYLPDRMVELVQQKSGLILIEGPTGSGKTTSIAALIDYINKIEQSGTGGKPRHIYSIEDPIEFYHKPAGNTVFTMREIGLHATDYASAVENALRSKPHIIVIGELLANETKKAALHAASTGHLVISTAHAGSANEAISSFIGGFTPEEQPMIRTQLSSTLLAIMCQTLVPKLDGKMLAVRELMINDINTVEILKDPEKAVQMANAIMKSGFTTESELIRYTQEGVISPTTALRTAKERKKVEDEFIRLGIPLE